MEVLNQNCFLSTHVINQTRKEEKPVTVAKSFFFKSLVPSEAEHSKNISKRALEKLGKAGETVKVAAGYFRKITFCQNFLLCLTLTSMLISSESSARLLLSITLNNNFTWLFHLSVFGATLGGSSTPPTLAVFFSNSEEFNIEKFELVEAENKKIRQGYEKKKKQMDVKRKM